MKTLHEKIKDKERPLVIAHRGSTILQGNPENTIPAFEEARLLGADGFELDIRLSKDGELVVFHDESLKRLLDVPRKVKNMTFDEISKVSFVSAFNNPTVRIPCIDKLFQTFGSQVYYNIEIKSHTGSYKVIVKKLVEYIYNHKLCDYVWVSSFDPRALRELKKVDADILTGYLFETYNLFTQTLCKNDKANWLHPSIEIQDHLNDLNGFHKPLCFWSVNNENDLKFLIEQNVSAIITDDVELARKVLLDGE